MPPEPEPGAEPPVLSLEVAAEAAEQDLVDIARGRLCAPAWRAGHRVGFMRGVAWAAWILGARLIRRPPKRGRATLDDK